MSCPKCGSKLTVFEYDSELGDEKIRVTRTDCGNCDYENQTSNDSNAQEVEEE